MKGKRDKRCLGAPMGPITGGSGPSRMRRSMEHSVSGPAECGPTENKHTSESKGRRQGAGRPTELVTFAPVELSLDVHG
ncbi:unnamed protein product, partial [Iphiclides podalirius]